MTTTLDINRQRRAIFMATALAILTSVFSTYGVAQITHGSGNDSAETRASDSTQRANPSGNTVVESQKPQSKDAAGGARGPTAGKDKNTEGAGGFNNGLYGTGAGNNSSKK
jgi:hypothetical protein